MSGPYYIVTVEKLAVNDGRLVALGYTGILSKNDLEVNVQEKIEEALASIEEGQSQGPNSRARNATEAEASWYFSQHVGIDEGRKDN